MSASVSEALPLGGRRRTTLSSKQDERKVRVLISDGFEELDTVPSRHVMVRDDAIECSAVETVETVVSTRTRLDIESVVISLEIRSSQLRKTRVVVYVENAYQICFVTHYTTP